MFSVARLTSTYSGERHDLLLRNERREVVHFAIVASVSAGLEIVAGGQAAGYCNRAQQEKGERPSHLILPVSRYTTQQQWMCDAVLHKEPHPLSHNHACARHKPGY